MNDAYMFMPHKDACHAQDVNMLNHSCKSQGTKGHLCLAKCIKTFDLLVTTQTILTAIRTKPRRHNQLKIDRKHGRVPIGTACSHSAHSSWHWRYLSSQDVVIRS